MRIEVRHNGTVVATVDLDGQDTFSLSADGEPVVGVLAGQTTLSWSTLAALVEATAAHLASPKT